MTDREYLRSLGFTVGERGRFSKEMLEALANRSKTETDEFINGALESVGLPPQTQQRPAQELYGLTKHGAKVGDRKSTRLNSSHSQQSRMPSSA